MTATVVARGALGRLGAIVAEHAPAHRVALVTDTTVGPLHAATVAAALGDPPLVVTIPAGEAHKTRATWAEVTDRLLAAGCGRDTTIVALGGGVVGDLAGFVAATFLRGVPVVQCPTTLLAMVDAAHGGKTAVDVPAGKNLVGAFHPPAAVVVDPDVLATLPPQVLRDGCAEVIKHAAIADGEGFAALVAALPALTGADGARHAAWPALIAASIEIKQGIVAADPTEQGRRRVLNFGHTIAHALEQASGYALSHGAAVAIGMVVEADLAVRLDLCAPAVPAALRAACLAAGLPVTIPAAVDDDAIVAATATDKKGARGTPRYALPEALGVMHAAGGAWAVPAPEALVRQAIAATRDAATS